MRGYEKGQEIETVILAIDSERERISLGVKQLEKDPFSNYVAEHAKGVLVTGTVTELDAKFATIQLAEGVEGILRAADISRERVEDARTVMKVGDKIEAKYMGLDKKNRSITLSIKAKDTDEEAEAIQEYGQSAVTGTGNTTLGDILKEQMDSQKE